MNTLKDAKFDEVSIGNYMARIPQEIIQQVLERCDIVAIVGRYVTLMKKGNRFWGLSPFKNEKTPSFSVDETSKLFYCFSTGQGGNIFTFFQKMENMSFVEAVKSLAHEVGVSIPNQPIAIQRKNMESDNTRTRDILLRIANTFEHFFWDESHRAVREYMKSRGFEDSILRTFRVGYAPEDRYWLYKFLIRKKYSDTELAESGLFSKKYPKISIFSNRVMFPIMAVNSSVLGFGGRLIVGDGPKYINSPQTTLFHKKRILYGLNNSVVGIKKHKKVFLVEGYLDVLALHQVGMSAAVAPLGTAFTDEQAQILRTMTDEVVMLFDNDEAGKNAAIKSAISFEKVGMPSIKIAHLSCADSAETLQKYGKEALREELLEQQEWFEYYISNVHFSYNSTYQEREQILNRIINYIITVQSDYRRSMYVSRVAEYFTIDARIIRKRINDAMSSVKKECFSMNTQVQDTSKKAFVTPVHTWDFLMMVSLCTQILLFAQVRVFCKVTDLMNDNARKIYIALEEVYRNDTINMQAVFALLEKPLSLYITKLIARGEIPEYSQGIIEHCKYYVTLSRLEKCSREIDMKIRKKSAQTENIKIMRELLEEKKFYVQRINELKKSHNLYETRA